MLVKAYQVAGGTLVYAAPTRFHTLEVAHQDGPASYTPTTDVDGVQSMMFLAGANPPFSGSADGCTFQVDAGPGQSACLHDNYSRWDPGFSLACSFNDVSNWVAARGGSLSQLNCDSPFYVRDVVYPSCIYHFGEERILYAPWARWEFLGRIAPPRTQVRDAFKATLMPVSADPLALAPELKVGNDQNSPVSAGYAVATRFSGDLQVFVFAGRQEGMYFGHAAIYLEGHGGSVLDVGSDTVQWLTGLGFTVYAMDLPQIGANNTIDGAAVATHNGLWKYEWSSLNPIWTEFVGPVYALAAKLKAEGQYKTVGAFGRSGGGWLAYMSGVISNDIDYVVSIAGGTPHAMRLAAPSGPYEIGDWEQYSPRTYSVVGHDELMAASGRLGAFYLYSRNDSCCFALAKTDVFIGWLNSADGMGGRTLRAFSDDQYESHGAGPSGLVEIERFLMNVIPQI